MTSSLARSVAAACVILLAACGGQAADETASTPSPGDGATTAPDATSSPGGDGSTFVGTLGGDPQLEGGCVWLEVDGERYELRLPPGYEADTDEIAIVPPSGEALTQGSELRVVGDVQRDVMTVCQVGPVLDATSISPAE